MMRIGVIAFLFISGACHVCAQTTYNGITLDRGKGNETNCIYVFNENSDSCAVIVQYKVGDRKTPWIDYPIDTLIPPGLDPQKVGCVDSAIIGLKLVDVIVMRSRHNDNDSFTPQPQEEKSFLQKLKNLFAN